jgi:hypothetical protein
MRYKDVTSEKAVGNNNNEKKKSASTHHIISYIFYKLFSMPYKTKIKTREYNSEMQTKIYDPERQCYSDKFT